MATLLDYTLHSISLIGFNYLSYMLSCSLLPLLIQNFLYVLSLIVFQGCHIWLEEWRYGAYFLDSCLWVFFVFLWCFWAFMLFLLDTLTYTLLSLTIFARLHSRVILVFMPWYRCNLSISNLGNQFNSHLDLHVFDTYIGFPHTYLILIIFISS